MKEIILIKFGGAVLTEREMPCTIRRNTMEHLAQQLSRCSAHFQGKLVLGNGGGSFGHYYASKFDLGHGVSTPEKLIGLCLGKAGNTHLNWELIQSLLRYHVPACACPIGASFSEKDERLELWTQIISYLECGVLPVLYGDMIYPGRQGCRIISTETIFLSFAQMLTRNQALGYQIGKIIFCTDREGVEDSQGNIIPIIERKNFTNWEIFWSGSKGYNVTGGMLEKVKIAFALQCPVQIINGNSPNSLEKVLDNDLSIGTIII